MRHPACAGSAADFPRNAKMVLSTPGVSAQRRAAPCSRHVPPGPSVSIHRRAARHVAPASGRSPHLQPAPRALRRCLFRRTSRCAAQAATGLAGALLFGAIAGTRRRTDNAHHPPASLRALPQTASRVIGSLTCLRRRELDRWRAACQSRCRQRVIVSYGALASPSPMFPRIESL